MNISKKVDEAYQRKRAVYLFQGLEISESLDEMLYEEALKEVQASMIFRGRT